MANIYRSALQLLKDLGESGTHPLSYLEAIAPDNLLKHDKDALMNDYRRNDEYADMTGFKRVDDPALRSHLLKYSGTESYEYSKPYRLSRAQLDEEIARQRASIQNTIDDYSKFADSPYHTAADKAFYRGEVERWKQKLDALNAKDVYSSYGKKGAQLLKTFYPAPNDLVLFRGLNPGSNTADRLHELEQRYAAQQEFAGNPLEPTPQVPNDWGNRGYLSATMSPVTAKSFGDWSATEGPTIGYSDKPSQRLFKILVPEGTPIRPLLNRVSDNPSENEVLLPPMSVYEQLGQKDEHGFLPLMWTGRGKPVSDKYIGAALPFLINKYSSQDDEQ